MQAAASRMQAGAVLRPEGDQPPHLTHRNAEMLRHLLRRIGSLQLRRHHTSRRLQPGGPLSHALERLRLSTGSKCTGIAHAEPIALTQKKSIAAPIDDLRAVSSIRRARSGSGRKTIRRRGVCGVVTVSLICPQLDNHRQSWSTMYLCPKTII
jgi:hypothetical protein